jgi:hypothetical protein
MNKGVFSSFLRYFLPAIVLLVYLIISGGMTFKGKLDNFAAIIVGGAPLLGTAIVNLVINIFILNRSNKSIIFSVLASPVITISIFLFFHFSIALVLYLASKDLQVVDWSLYFFINYLMPVAFFYSIVLVLFSWVGVLVRKEIDRYTIKKHNLE